jgi:hypothetical protein
VGGEFSVFRRSGTNYQSGCSFYLPFSAVASSAIRLSIIYWRPVGSFLAPHNFKPLKTIVGLLDWAGNRRRMAGNTEGIGQSPGKSAFRQPLAGHFQGGFPVPIS